MHKFPDLPPIWTIAMIVLAWLLGRFLPILAFDAPTWIPGVLGLAGLFLIVWSALWFWRKKTTIEPHEKPTALIVEGPYRISRNPIYLGMCAIVLAAAFWFGAISSFLPAITLPIIITSRFIKAEEAALSEAFGAQADAYFNRTRRWLI